MYKKEKQIPKKTRNLNFEALRIISMILIVAHHFTLYSYKQLESPFEFETFVMEFFKTGGKYGIILFVLITGYFSVDKPYERKRILKVILHTEFYSYLFLFIMIFLGQDITFQSLRYSLFPVIFGSYWFVSTYVILYLLIPYLNILINKLTLKQFIELILILSTFITIIPSFSFSNFSIGNVGILIYIYILGAFIKIDGHLFLNKKQFYLKKGILFYMTAYFMIPFISLLSLKNSLFEPFKYLYISLNSIFLYISAINIFIYFCKIKIDRKWEKIILPLSTITFGAYLIHENYFIRTILWNQVSNLITNDSFLFVIISIIIIVFVYIGCSAIDYIYHLYFEKTILKYGNIIYDFIKEKIKKLESEKLL